MSNAGGRPLEESLLEELSFLTTYLKSKTEEVTDLKQKLQDANLQIVQMRTQNQQLSSEREGLETFIAKQREMIASAEEFKIFFAEKNKSAELQRRFQTLSEEARQNSEARKAQEAQLRQQIEQNKLHWRAEVDELMTQIVELKQDKSRAASRLNELETVNAQLNVKLAEVLRESQNLRDSMSTMKEDFKKDMEQTRSKYEERLLEHSGLSGSENSGAHLLKQRVFSLKQEVVSLQAKLREHVAASQQQSNQHLHQQQQQQAAPNRPLPTTTPASAASRFKKPRPNPSPFQFSMKGRS